MSTPKAGDTMATRNEYISEKHRMNISVSNSVHLPSAMDKNLNTDCTENTDLAFSLIFLVGKWLLDLFWILVDLRVLGHSLFPVRFVL